MHEAMCPQVQERRSILGDESLAAERAQTGRHHWDGVARPVLLHVLKHEGILGVQLYPVRAFVQGVGDLGWEAFQSDLQVFILKEALLRLGALLPHVVADTLAVELQHRFAADHDVGDADQVDRQRDDAAVFQQVDEYVGILEVLQEDAPHAIFKADAVVVFLIFLLGLFVRADLSPVVRKRERRIDALDDAPEDGVGVHEIVAQLVQAVDIALLVPKDAVVVIASQVAGKGDVLVVIGHRRPAVVLRAYGNLDFWCLLGLIPRLHRAALSLEPSHFQCLLMFY